MSEKLLVEACEDRAVPLHATDYGDGTFILRAGDPAIEVPNSTGIRRRIRAGDLRIVPPLAERVDAKLATGKFPEAQPASTTSGK